MKKYSVVFLCLIIASLPMILYSCCSDDTCSEEDPYGKMIVKQTDTIYRKVPKFQAVGPYSVQIAAFANKANAEKFVADAKSKLTVPVEAKFTQEGIYRIVIGEYKTIESARETLQLVKSKGYTDSFIRDEFGLIEK